MTRGAHGWSLATSVSTDLEMTRLGKGFKALEDIWSNSFANIRPLFPETMRLVTDFGDKVFGNWTNISPV